MTKSDLITSVADKVPGNHKKDAEVIVNTIFDRMVEALAKGDRIEIRGFGSFHLRKRDARVGRDPKTGNRVEVPQKHVPFFKAGKELRLRVDSRAGEPLPETPDEESSDDE
jgi:integration host factor subunit beta